MHITYVLFQKCHTFLQSPQKLCARLFSWVCECSKSPPHHVNWFIFCFIKDLIGLLYFQIPAQTWEILEEGLNPAMDLKTPCTSVCRHVFMGVYWKLNKANSRWGGFGILKISILNQLLTMLEPSTLVSVANVQPTKQPFLDRATRTDFL